MGSEFNFVAFEDAGGKFGSYKISLGEHGGFGFNAGFYRRENMKEYSHVFLSYDKSRKAVGFFFSNDSTIRGAFKISHGKNSGSVVVHSFFSAHFINPKDYAGKYEPNQYEDSKLGKLFYIILERKGQNENL